jgi:hypothetical protein
VIHLAGSPLLASSTCVLSKALEIIDNNGRAVEEAKRLLRVSDDDMEAWKIEQEEYFSMLGDESESKVRVIAYVELLQKLRQLK